MPIRDEQTYAKMSYNDFKVAFERLKRGELKLSAWRAYKSLRRMLQSLAMKYDLHRKDTPCAVPKNCMIRVAEELEKYYNGITEMTKEALRLFDEWKENYARREDIIKLLKELRFEWISSHLTKEEMNEIEEIKKELENL
jgi:hypothetical protein